MLPQSRGTFSSHQKRLFQFKEKGKSCPGVYRFGFQGQETDDEIYGGENAVSYKYRVHDPRLGRFLSLDPLAPKYPHNSPYAFSENRVIDGVELEGLEYLNSNESRIHISHGIVRLKLSNFHNVTLSEMRRNLGLSKIDHDPYGNEYIGLNTVIFSFHHPMSHLVSPRVSWTKYPGPIRNNPGRPVLLNAYIEAERVEPEPSTPNFKLPAGKTLDRPLNNDGSPRMWYKVNKVYWPILETYFAELTQHRYDKWDRENTNRELSYAVSPGVRGAAGLLLFIDVTGRVMQMTKNYQIGSDMTKLNQHLNILSQAMSDVASAVQSGDIPDEYINNSSLSAIVNFVLLGENTTDDPHIEELGQKVIECHSSCELQDE